MGKRGLSIEETRKALGAECAIPVSSPAEALELFRARHCRPNKETPTPVCPQCSGSDLVVKYSAPLQADCEGCGALLVSDQPGIRIISEEDARTKRPGMYGLPACRGCQHGIHEEGACRWCTERLRWKWILRT